MGFDETIAAMGPTVSPQNKSPIGSDLSKGVKSPSYGVEFIISKFIAGLRSYGLFGFIGLYRRFRGIDKEGRKVISLTDFKKALKNMNSSLGDGEFRAMFEHFDEDDCGLIDYELFIEGVRPVLSASRLALVKRAFNRLDKYGSGLLEAGDMASQFDASRHPDVLSGSCSPQEVLSSFLETFDVGTVIENKVSQQEFINYYSNISTGIDNDDYFEMMVYNVWHLEEYSGGERPPSETASKRVLKIFSDGNQYVEEPLYNDSPTNGQISSSKQSNKDSNVSTFSSYNAAPGKQDLSGHKLIQLNKRRSFQQKPTSDIISDVSILKKSSMPGGALTPSAGVQIYLNILKDGIKERGSQSLFSLIKVH
jgi:Ca2+-binding EF-hand superfamily protein